MTSGSPRVKLESDGSYEQGDSRLACSRTCGAARGEPLTRERVPEDHAAIEERLSRRWKTSFTLG